MPIGSDTYAYRRRLPHLEKPGKTYFVTFCTINREVLPDEARTIALRCCLYDNKKMFWLHSGVIMPDHVHLLMTPLADATGFTYRLAGILERIKGASSHKINQLMGRSGPLWLDERFDRMMRAGDDIRKTAEYIIMNPVRRGLVTAPDEYPWIWREWIEGLRDDERAVMK